MRLSSLGVLGCGFMQIPKFFDIVHALSTSGKGFTFSGHTAGYFHGLCDGDVTVAEIMNPVGVFPYISKVSPLLWTEVLYDDIENRIPLGNTGNFYTGLHQTVLDMINSERSIDRTDDALKELRRRGLLEEIVGYCRQHGLCEDKLQYALEGLE